MEDSTTYTHLDEIIDKYDNFICDVDGVLFNGTVMIDGTPEGLQYLRDNNKKFYFVSNSSARTRKYMVEKFKKMGITIFENEAFSSGYTTSVYLRLQHPEIKKVYVIGERGLMEQLEAFDNGSGEFLKTIGGPEETETTMTHTENENYELDPEVGAVVWGYDTDVSYRKIAIANLYIQNGCKFIACNDDMHDAAHTVIGDKVFNRLIPVTGVTVKAIEYATGVKAYVWGKPNPLAFDLVALSSGVDPTKIDKSKWIMFGDRLSTDISFAHNSGIDSALMLTGVSSLKDIDDPTQNPDLVKPTYIFKRFGSFSKPN